jgi:predicted GNAT family N-acyltransferase
MNSDNLRLQTAEWESPLGELLRALRIEVFVEEQQVPPDEEIDDIDPDAVHLVVLDGGGKVLATGRFFDADGRGMIGRIGRMAVAKSARGRGVGRMILRGLMVEGLRRGFGKMILDAQVQAIPFYEDSGFVAYGEEHLDCGIPHRMMEITRDEAIKVLQR